MGHGNMLLAVAGLKDAEVKTRTKKLALGQWDDYNPAERQALAFGIQLTKEPAKITDKQVSELVKTFGAARAMDVIWYSSWVNFMTRFADAFQLPLEKENVFAAPAKKPKDGEKPR